MSEQFMMHRYPDNYGQHYRLTGPPPCTVKDVIQIGSNYYEVDSLEPLFYEFRNIVGGVDAGFITAVYAVPALIPPANRIYYNTGIGINGRIAVQIRYEAGHPRNNVGAVSNQRLDRFQAPYLTPFTFKFGLVTGNTLEVDIAADFVNVRAAIWFYGWNFYIKTLKALPAGVVPILLEDVREG